MLVYIGFTSAVELLFAILITALFFAGVFPAIKTIDLLQAGTYQKVNRRVLSIAGLLMPNNEQAVSDAGDISSVLDTAYPVGATYEPYIHILPLLFYCVQ